MRQLAGQPDDPFGCLQDETGDIARQRLQPVLSEFADRLLGGKTLLSHPLQNVLSSHQPALPQLPLPATLQSGQIQPALSD